MDAQVRSSAPPFFRARQDEKISQRFAGFIPCFLCRDFCAVISVLKNVHRLGEPVSSRRTSAHLERRGQTYNTDFKTKNAQIGSFLWSEKNKIENIKTAYISEVLRANQIPVQQGPIMLIGRNKHPSLRNLKKNVIESSPGQNSKPERNGRIVKTDFWKTDKLDRGDVEILAAVANRLPQGIRPSSSTYAPEFTWSVQIHDMMYELKMEPAKAKASNYNANPEWCVNSSIRLSGDAVFLQKDPEL
ncbi:unnamed protein product [Nesidiocoris tenuis]|uniref:Uncharacterized protein n=1 Tax=Nesidiocoris tenuis TaxID=355587 RepID=A0A6H5FZS9_9HEMI|nr:unnamed protein product [Nesidiocoris tenuis]